MRASEERRISRPQSIGVTVSETIPETRMAKVRVSANSRRKRPMIPPRKISGMKAATRDRLIEITVKPICREPLSAARRGRMPASRLR